jgi:hypothetical protein
MFIFYFLYLIGYPLIVILLKVIRLLVYPYCFFICYCSSCYQFHRTLSVGDGLPCQLGDWIRVGK